METLMTSDEERLQYINSIPDGDGSCAHCHKPGDLAWTEICDQCFEEIYADR